jgi:hypothetical protein
MIASVLLSLVGACSAETPPGTATATLPPTHANAMRDSVRGFLSAYGADVGAPPIGRNAREALAPFYAPDIVVSTDLSPDEPVVVATLDSLVPANEVVSQPAWIRSTRFEWGAMIVTPLAPGVATYTAKYTEHVIDTTGGTTSLSGVQHGVVRHGSDGWRFIAVQSSHPMATHQRQAALVARMTKAP